MRRTVVTAAIAVGWLLAGASPAAAHSISGAGASNYETRLEGVAPRIDGIEMKVVEEGSRFELTNTTAEDVVVLGYQEEPYLRVGPGGVFENRRSPAIYLNASRKGDTTVPGTADPKAPPEWEKTSGGQTVRWHDHRIHWMGDQEPPAVRRAPDRRQVVIPDWKIPVRAGDRLVVATGDLLWVPGPSPLPWLLVAVVLFGGVAALALSRTWAVTIAGVAAVLVLVDVGHAIGIGFAKAGSTGAKIGEVAAGNFYSVLAWAAGVVAVWMLTRRRPDGLLFAAFAGAFIALSGGLVDITDLSRSQVPFAWDPVVARAMVAVSLGGGFGLLAAAVIGLRRSRVPPELPPAAQSAS